MLDVDQISVIAKDPSAVAFPVSIAPLGDLPALQDVTAFNGAGFANADKMRFTNWTYSFDTPTAPIWITISESLNSRSTFIPRS